MRPADGIPFHPYYTVKDTLGVVVFLAIFFAVVFFMPEMGGYFLEQPNFEPANPLKTPEHIAPVWYFTPYYAILRAVPSFAGTQVWGVLVMFAALIVFFFLPWLDRSPVKSIRYQGWISKVFLGTVRDFLRGAGLSRHPAADASADLAGADIHAAVFRLFPVDAVLQRAR